MMQYMWTYLMKTQQMVQKPSHAALQEISLRSARLIWQTNQYIYHVILDPLTLLLQQVIHPKL